MIYDVGIIGAGIIGAAAARELSRYKLDICIIEKENDVSCGTSKANSGIIHAGYDPEPGTLIAHLNVKGNELYSKWARELHFDFERIGSLTIAFNEDEAGTAARLYDRGKENGVPGLRLLNADEIREMDPSISEEAVCALYAPSAGIISPYQAVWAIAENAVMNGVKFYRECEVHSIQKDADGNFVLETGKGPITCRRVVNAAGLYADKISAMAGGSPFVIKPRRGEYCLFDNNCCGLVKHVLFQIPGKMGKGVLVTPTVDGNILVGPSADDRGTKDDFSTTKSGQDFILEKAEKTLPGLPRRSIINSFSGSRSIAYRASQDGSGELEHVDDFIIEEDLLVPGLIQTAGICSPGLTAAPAIAEYVCELLKKTGLELVPNTDFIAVHKGIKSFKHADDKGKEKLVEENKLYGRIICRCEMITEAEIVQALRCPLGARDLDGVKRRTRAGMGRCQGGFCSPRITEIISRELNIPMINVTKNGGSSFILDSKTRDVL